MKLLLLLAILSTAGCTTTDTQTIGLSFMGASVSYTKTPKQEVKVKKHKLKKSKPIENGYVK